MSTYRQQSTEQSRQSSQRYRPPSGRQRRPQTYRTAVGLTDETRQTVVSMLNQSLADTTDLMTQAKFAHWNVKGMNFYQLHLLFDEIAETFEGHVDTIAERATALGGEATGTARTAAANSRIPEIPPDATTGPEFVEALVERVGVHANNLRADIDAAVEYGDEDTADMYTELSREVDKQLYFLEAHLQAVEGQAIPSDPGASTQGGQSGQGANVSQYRESGQSARSGQPSRSSQGGQRYQSEGGQFYQSEGGQFYQAEGGQSYRGGQSGYGPGSSY